MIIKFGAGIPEIDALRLVFDVVKDGRISNDGKQFCYHTAIHTEDGWFDVATDLTATGTDVFTITRAVRGVYDGTD